MAKRKIPAIVVISADDRSQHLVPVIAEQWTVQGAIVITDPIASGFSDQPKFDPIKNETLQLRRIDLAEVVVLITWNGNMNDTLTRQHNYATSIGVVPTVIAAEEYPQQLVL